MRRYQGNKKDFIEEEKIIIPVQINGKLRETLVLSREGMSNQKQVEERALKSEKISLSLKGKKIRKVIYVPGKVINFVVG